MPMLERYLIPWTSPSLASIARIKLMERLDEIGRSTEAAK
jgi:hypothetical protein